MALSKFAQQKLQEERERRNRQRRADLILTFSLIAFTIALVLEIVIFFTKGGGL